MIAEDFFKFMLKFVEKYPEFKGRPLFVTGESYAGHYIPAIAAYIKMQNNQDLNLQGFAIGNGWTDPYQQYPAYNTFATENNLIGSIQSKALTVGFKVCQGLISTKIWPVALESCQLLLTSILGNPVSPSFNPYDIRIPCDKPPLCYDFSLLDKFLLQPEVEKRLGVAGRSWTSCNMLVHTVLLGDWMVDFSAVVTYLLQSGVKGLVYSGDKDFVCNWRGGEAWTNALDWDHNEEF